MPLAKIKTKLAPPPSQWHHCCVPVDLLLKQSTIMVQRRKLFLNALLFLAYFITLLVTVLTITPSQTIFMSNARQTTNIMYWNRALVPQRVTSYSTDSNYSMLEGQWFGEYTTGWAVRSLRAFETWVQTQLLFSSSCDMVDQGMKCVLPPLMQQLRSTQFSQCVPFAQTAFEESLVCLGGVTFNCELGASMDPGTCNANQPNAVNTNPSFPLLPDNQPTVCTPLGFNIDFGCQFVESCGWANQQIGTTPAAVGETFNSNPTMNVTLDEMSRIISVTETLQNTAPSFPSFIGIEYQAQSQLSGYIRLMTKVQTLPEREDNQGILVASGFLATFMLLDMIFFVKRLIQHPFSLLTPWLLLDLIIISFYVILFMVLNEGIWNPYHYSTSTGQPTMKDSCVIETVGNRAQTNLQLVGATVALSFLTMFRFMTLLPFSRLALASLVMAFRKLIWALFIIAVVYLLNALACMIFFGSNAYVFRLLNGSFFSVLIIPEGFDVAFIAQQMQRALPSYSPVPSLYFTLIVFVLNKCVSSMVTAIVAIGYILTTQKEGLSKVSNAPGSGSSAADTSSMGVSTVRAGANTTRTANGNKNGADHAPSTVDPSNNGSPGHPGESSQASWSCSRLWKRIRTTRFWLYSLSYLYEILSGTRSYEVVDVETAFERLARWAKMEDNAYKSFITYEEIKMILSIVDEITRVKIDDRQVMDLFQICGPVNIYWIEDARNFERNWMDTVNLEGGKGERYKRKKAEVIAIQANRIADLAGLDDRQSDTEGNDGESAVMGGTAVNREIGAGDADSDVVTRIKHVRMGLNSLKVKKANMEQVLESMLDDAIHDQHAFEGDVGRFATHFEVTNQLRSLGIVVNKDMFQVRAPTVEKVLAVWGVDLVVCRDPYSANEFVLELPGPFQDDIAREGLKNAKKMIKDHSNPDRFIQIPSRDWSLLTTDGEKAAFLYFLIRGVRIQVFPSLKETSVQVGLQARGKRGGSLGGKMPLTPIRILSLERHAFVVCFLREDERPQHDPQWERLRSVRESTRYYDTRIKDDAAEMFLRSVDWDPDQIFQLGEFIADVTLVDTEKECYLKVRIDCGVPILDLDEDNSPLVGDYLVGPVESLEYFYEAAPATVASSSSSAKKATNTGGAAVSNVNKGWTSEYVGPLPNLIIVEVNSKPVRTLHDLGDSGKFTFRSPAMQNSPPKYSLRFARVTRRRVLIRSDMKSDEAVV